MNQSVSGIKVSSTRENINERITFGSKKKLLLSMSLWKNMHPVCKLTPGTFFETVQ